MRRCISHRVLAWRSLAPSYHVIMHSRDGRVIDRVPHDYQRIVPEFRGDGIAFPSDQGLHIVNGSNFTLTSAVGDMRNTMSLSAIISPSSTYPGSRNLVVNVRAVAAPRPHKRAVSCLLTA